MSGMVGTVVATFTLDSYLQRRAGTRSSRRDRLQVDTTGPSATGAAETDGNQRRTGQGEYTRRSRRAAARQTAASPDNAADAGATAEDDEQIGAARP